MVFNAIVNNISVILVEKTAVYPLKTIDLPPQVIDNFYHIMFLSSTPRHERDLLKPLVAIGTGYIATC